MSTIVRSWTGRRAAARSRGDDVRAPLSARAVRVRNAYLRRAASELGLPIPGDDDLSALGNDVTLARAVESWRIAHGQHGAAAASEPLGRRSRFFARAVLMSAVALLSLALSFGQVQ